MTEQDKLQELQIPRYSDLELEELENRIDAELETALSDMQILKENREKIGNPDTLGETVMNVVWEQFIIQVGAVAGEDFIKENRGLTLDLSKDAHIQTTENFEKGKIATHNTSIDYQERYDNWQPKLAHDKNGNPITYTDRSGIEKTRLSSSTVRQPFDKARPTGSVENGTDMDHTVPAAEIIRDPAANAHLTEKQQIDFANSDENLNEMPSSHNRSKGDKSMSEWLDNPNKNGQKPNEIFDDLDDDKATSYRKKDEEARKKFDEVKQRGEKESIESGQKSQRQEAIRMGKKALQGVIMMLLAALVKTIFQKFVAWLRSKKRTLDTLIEKFKEAIHKFFSELKQHIKDAAKAAISSIVTMIIGPIASTLQKAWLFIKQGYKSLKEVIAVWKNPQNSKKTFSELLTESGKIIIAGITVVGGITLSEVIKDALSSAAPFFAIEIPLLGSLANIIGIFLGALIAGVIGALALRWIDAKMAKIQLERNVGHTIDNNTRVITLQGKKQTLERIKFDRDKTITAVEIVSRHRDAESVAEQISEKISENLAAINDTSSIENILPSENSDEIDNLLARLES